MQLIQSKEPVTIHMTCSPSEERSRTVTAGGEFHPALKITVYEIFTIATIAQPSPDVNTISKNVRCAAGNGLSRPYQEQ